MTWQVFGDDFLISTAKLRDKRPITCISYVETAALTRADLEEVRAQGIHPTRACGGPHCPMLTPCIC